MQLPPRPGVYVVELMNDEPVSVNADRPAIAERCIKVTRANCKFGRAANLARRQREYHKTFGQENVNFRFFAITQEYIAIEAEVASRLTEYRIPGTTGRLNEWLQGISPESVENIVRAVLDTFESKNTVLPQASSVSKSHLPSTHEPIGVTPSRLVEAVQYLQVKGLSVEMLRDMHHSRQRGETFASSIRYFRQKQELQSNNLRYGARLIYVMDQHRQTGRGFSELVHEALRRHPL